MTDTTKHIINKLLVRLLVILAVLAVLDIIYYFTLYKKDLDENTTLMEISQRANKGIDIVYLGESSNFSYAETDTDQRFICMMIEDSLPGHHVGNLTKGS